MGLTGFNLFCQMLIMTLYLRDPASEMSPGLKSFVSCLNGLCCRRSQRVQPSKEHNKIGDTPSSTATKPNNAVTLDEDLIKAIQLFLEKMENDNKQDEWKEEWKTFARLLDMTFFIISFVMHAAMIAFYFLFV